MVLLIQTRHILLLKSIKYTLLNSDFVIIEKQKLTNCIIVVTIKKKLKKPTLKNTLKI